MKTKKSFMSFWTVILVAMVCCWNNSNANELVRILIPSSTFTNSENSEIIKMNNLPITLFTFPTENLVINPVVSEKKESTKTDSVKVKKNTTEITITLGQTFNYIDQIIGKNPFAKGFEFGVSLKQQIWKPLYAEIGVNVGKIEFKNVYANNFLKEWNNQEFLYALFSVPQIFNANIPFDFQIGAGVKLFHSGVTLRDQTGNVISVVKESNSLFDERRTYLLPSIKAELIFLINKRLALGMEAGKDFVLSDDMLDGRAARKMDQSYWLKGKITIIIAGAKAQRTIFKFSNKINSPPPELSLNSEVKSPSPVNLNSREINLLTENQSSDSSISNNKSEIPIPSAKTFPENKEKPKDYKSGRIREVFLKQGETISELLIRINGYTNQQDLKIWVEVTCKLNLAVNPNPLIRKTIGKKDQNGWSCGLVFPSVDKKGKPLGDFSYFIPVFFPEK